MVNIISDVIDNREHETLVLLLDGAKLNPIRIRNVCKARENADCDTRFAKNWRALQRLTSMYCIHRLNRYPLGVLDFHVVTRVTGRYNTLETRNE